MLRVNVRAATLGTEEVVTNDFTVAFEKQRAAITPVVPHSISDAWLYIHGYRQHQSEVVSRTCSSSNYRHERVPDWRRNGTEQNMHAVLLPDQTCLSQERRSKQNVITRLRGVVDREV